MTISLPASIEAYLVESGFSPTELLLIQKLLELGPSTLRELAAKTGKSTGVLDQAMKKLIRREIVERVTFNDTPKFRIQSLDALMSWAEKDVKEKRAQLERKRQSFSEYIESLKEGQKKPDIQYFTGDEGIIQAYRKLLESGQELLTWTPVLYRAEDDPLRAFRVEYFRVRQVRKIFQRVIAPDTPLARRYQFKDPFEYRQTILVPPDECPLPFEKTIVGDTIACIDFQGKTASFLRFPELAQAEKASFQATWNRVLKSPPSGSTNAPPAVPKRTKALSELREFILSRRSIVVLTFFALLSGALTMGLYMNHRSLNLERLRDEARSIVTTGALQFDAADLAQIQTEDDIRKPVYAKTVALLNLIRRSNPNIRYAYIMRKTDDPLKLSFVADADSLRPKDRKDLNHDGVLNAADALSYPGDQYDISAFPEMLSAFERPYVDKDVVSDAWGEFISGAAPIRDERGTVVAILGVDILATNLDKLVAKSFSALFVFVGFFLLFAIVRFGAVNRSLMREIYTSLTRRKLLVFLTLTFFSLLLYSSCRLALYYRNTLLMDEMGKRLMAIAVTAADDFDPADLDQLRFARDMKTEAYQRVFKKLNEIRDKNPEVTFGYIFRILPEKDMYEFVADADANYYLPEHAPTSITDFQHFDDNSENASPGVRYFDYDHLVRSSDYRPAYGSSFDQWGAYISGWTIIKAEDGSPSMVIGFDANVQ